MWRLRMLLMGRGRWILGALAGLLAAAAAAVVVSLVFFGGGSGKKGATDTAAQTPQPTVVNFYLRALAPTTEASGCTMKITFTWKPDYQARLYVGQPAEIQVIGTGIAGRYRRRFSKTGVTLGPLAVSLAGGYQLWSARVLSLGGDAPGNDTTVQAAPPTSSKCR